MTKLILVVAFHDFDKMPKKEKIENTYKTLVSENRTQRTVAENIFDLPEILNFTFIQ
jgi:hypothetical protein